MKRIENKDQEVKKIVIVEVPYKIMKEYFAAQNEIEEEDFDDNPYDYSMSEVYDIEDDSEPYKD